MVGPLSSRGRCLVSLLLVVGLGSPAAAQVLFDGGNDSRPDTQGWAYLTNPVFGASAVRRLRSEATELDTSPAEADQAGWFAHLPPLPSHSDLPNPDRATGFTVRWTVRVDVESHSSPDRAGLSVIVLSSDGLGVEIGHWSDEVWVQASRPLFTHGEGAGFDTTAARTEYALCVLGDRYTLRADGLPLFDGDLRDYSEFGAPYDIPNFLFVGDDTGSAASRFEWARFEVEATACGCDPGLPDRDGDGTADCADQCPEDPGKSLAGACGCSLPDLDRDADTVPDCDVVPGDLDPDGLGDGSVGLADLLLAHRKLVLETSSIRVRDLRVGDLSPSSQACLPAGGSRRACPAPDGDLDLDDGRRIRSLVASALELSCEPCPDPVLPNAAEARLPGDVAPRGPGGDAVVDVGDAVQTLRWAVGLDPTPLAEELLRADVAPDLPEEGLRIVDGDGDIDVADVLSVLRTAVGLSRLAWPARELHADLTDNREAVAFSLRVDGWPAAASVVDAESPHCPAGGIGGLDDAGARWSLTCVSEPGVVSGPARLGTLRYRAPERVDPSALTAEVLLLDAALAESTAAVTLSDD